MEAVPRVSSNGFQNLSKLFAGQRGIPFQVRSTNCLGGSYHAELLLGDLEVRVCVRDRELQLLWALLVGEQEQLCPAVPGGLDDLLCSALTSALVRVPPLTVMVVLFQNMCSSNP
jgi:hypothetical protein